MKILYINSVYQYGSTGRLVKELMEAAKGQGHDVLCVYGRHFQGDIEDTYYIGSKVESAYHVLMTRLFGRHGMHSTNATKKLIKKIETFQPDTIHLHNLHGYYLNVPMLMSYLKTINVKIIWTLHDTWTVSGSAAYFDYNGCKLWDEGCVINNVTNEYPHVWFFPNQKRNFKWKQESFSGFDNLHIITVSDWLKDLIMTTFLKSYKITRIYNGIDLNLFQPKEKEVSNKKIKILGVANIWEERKGLKDFIKLSKVLPSNYEITLIGLSENQIKDLPKNIIGITRTSSLEELVKYYQDTNLYLNLSVEETMGLTTVEALACGTPCIVYDKTAVPEIVDPKSGIIVPANDIDQLLKVIETFDYKKYSRNHARNRAKMFSLQQMYSNNLSAYSLE